MRNEKQNTGIRRTLLSHLYACKQKLLEVDGDQVVVVGSRVGSGTAQSCGVNPPLHRSSGTTSPIQQKPEAVGPQQRIFRCCPLTAVVYACADGWACYCATVGVGASGRGSAPVTHRARLSTPLSGVSNRTTGVVFQILAKVIATTTGLPNRSWTRTWRRLRQPGRAHRSSAWQGIRNLGRCRQW